MNASQTGSFKIPVSQKHIWLATLTALLVVDVYTALLEGNHMFWFALIAAVVAVVSIDVFEEDGRVGLFTRENRGGLAVVSAAFLFVIGAPLLHFVDGSKIWIVGDKTSIDNAVLIRSPFAPLATSIDKRHDIAFRSVAVTKEGISVMGIVTGAFRLADDEGEIVSVMGARKNPNLEIRRDLIDMVDKAFGDAIARRNVADISALANDFALEVDVATAVTVKQLGLRRNGFIAVSNLHPYFVDR